MISSDFIRGFEAFFLSTCHLHNKSDKLHVRTIRLCHNTVLRYFVVLDCKASCLNIGFCSRSALREKFVKCAQEYSNQDREKYKQEYRVRLVMMVVIDMSQHLAVALASFRSFGNFVICSHRDGLGLRHSAMQHWSFRSSLDSLSKNFWIQRVTVWFSF